MILVIDVRGLHIGFLGCYGNVWVATPNLDRLAAEGIVFDQHYVNSPGFDISCPVELPGVKRIETSLLPPWNLPAELLNVYGEEDDAFDPWVDPPLALFDSDNIPDLDRLQKTYAAAVTHWDARLGEVLAPLRKSGQLDDMLVCVTASSGLPLGEHGQIGPCRPWLYEEAVHVPLVMRLPKGREAGLRIAALTQACDLQPAVVEFQKAAGRSANGSELWRLVNGDAESIRQYIALRWRIGPAAEKSLRTRDWCLIAPEATFPGDLPRNQQLFVKPEDRWEVNDVRLQNLELAEELERRLNDLVWPPCS